MRKSLVLSLVAVSILAVASFGQWEDRVESIQLYWQPDPATVVFNPACPYLFVRPDIDMAAVMQTWLADHVNQDGSLARPVEIGMVALPLLDVFFGDNDLIAFWHQITNYGPIKDVQTLSKMQTISVTRKDPKTGGYPESTWTCSLGEVLQLLPFFKLRMGTSDGLLPDRYQQ